MGARLFESVVVFSPGGWSPALPTSVALHAAATALLLAAFERSPIDLPALAAVPTILRMPAGMDAPPMRGTPGRTPARARSTAGTTLRVAQPQLAAAAGPVRDHDVAAESPVGDGTGSGCNGCSPEGDPDGVEGGAGTGAPGASGARSEPVEPIRVGGHVLPPLKVHHVNPEYPAMARVIRVQGTVILECVIGTDGRVTDVRVLRGVPLLDAAALAAVQQWVYEPTRLNGQPVSVVMTVTVRFALS
jgi:protein TonB